MAMPKKMFEVIITIIQEIIMFDYPWKIVMFD